MSTEEGHESPAAGARESAQSWKCRGVDIALIFLVFFIVGGAPAPHVNETHYLTKAKHYWDPSYCPGDLFLDSADPHLVFYWTFGWLTKLLSLTATAWIGRVVAWALLAAAWERLSNQIIRQRWLAVLSASIWVALIEYGNFAGEWVIGGIEAKCIAYAFVLLGWGDMAAGRWKRPWIWFGLASAFHVLVGAWAVLAAMAVWLTEPRVDRLPLLRMLPGLLIGGLLSLPGLLPALALERNADPAIAQEAARIYVFDRLPHHLAPLTLPVVELQRRLTRFGVMAAAFVALWAWVQSCRKKTVADEFRDSDLASRDRWRRLDRLMRLAGVALTCNCIGLGTEAALLEQPLAAARLLRYYWFRQADVAVPLAVALSAAVLIWVRLQEGARASFLATAVALAGCAWFFFVVISTRLEVGVPPAARKTEDFPAWRDACLWIREHAPPDAQFLIPRSGQSFKWYAARADVGNYKDVPQDAASVVEWRRRTQELFPVVGEGEFARTLASPEQWGTERVQALAQKYGATHVLARSFPPLSLPIVYPPSGDPTGCYYVVYETGVSAGEGKP